MKMENQKTNKWKIAFILFVVIIIIAGVFAFGYHQTIKEEKYLEGGRDAINSIIQAINSSGGATLTLENDQTISIARYNKN